MRLEKIKLSGFKSFVDPTTIHLKSSLVGVVGPNGCGKSNIIDAVRWVMGESSAKNLRGDAMVDVIFNGSNDRKPIGQASVELVFDNSDGGLGGEYAQYSQISIRREVNREAQSTYYLNGTRCRRRDITDIFLGTGMGPRSYSIIQQGTISRFIEAKPDELRQFIEEAAGISKYKERRRETENRMRHTRENLERLNDLREEIGKQLEHLQRQARAAERYKALKQEERLLKARLQALRLESLAGGLDDQEALIRELEVQLEACIAEQRRADREIEELREQQIELNEAFNEVQSKYYSVGNAIARLEQAIQHNRERRTQLSDDLVQIEASLAESQRHSEHDNQQITRFNEQIAALNPKAQAHQAQADESQQLLMQAEHAMREWQQDWDAFNEVAAQASQQSQVEQTRIQHIEQRIREAMQRCEKLQEELNKIEPQDLQSEVVQDEHALVAGEARAVELKANLEETLAAIQSQREQNRELNSELDNARGDLQSLCGRHASLEALQQAALGKQGGRVVEWLERHELAQRPRLAQALQVRDGWDNAVETVLGPTLEAVCASGIDSASELLADLEQGYVTLFDTQASHNGAADMGASKAATLLSKVSAPWNLYSLLSGIYIAESLTDALQLRHRLAAHESVITRDGIWMGASWLRVSKGVDERIGVLQRENEMRELGEKIAHLQQHVAEQRDALEAGRQYLQDLENQRETQQATITEFSAEQGQRRAQLTVKQSRLEQLRKRSEDINSELTELTQACDANRQALDESRDLWQQALSTMEGQAARRDALTEQREVCRQDLDGARQRAQQDKDQAHEYALQLQNMQTQLSALEQAKGRLDKQVNDLLERQKNLQTAIAEGEMPLQEMDAQLQTTLEQRAQVEEQMTQAKRRLDSVEHQLREREHNRSESEENVQTVRGQLEQQRMEWQGTKVRLSTVAEQLQETGYELQTLLEEMPEEVTEAGLETELERTGRRIQRLGAINLAAIEEYDAQSERKEYLDAQHVDLTTALETLENAIRKIDRETRTRFKETYDIINGHFQTLFPKLFGGGSASLEMTGEDLLDTGVTLMARPPGKRNVNIHQLSGGEKALTAISLVFAIFQLNPAPFCMLDEVDAPLDDANVGRFCRLVESMAESVQIVFISHNKLAIEMANQLAGVTMNEPGVSRMVSVDIEEAVAMADADAVAA